MRYLLLLCFAAPLFGQGTEPKRSAAEYEVHAQTPHMDIGAEYTVHSFSRGDESYITEDYLVVEVALFPKEQKPFQVENGQFALRINGKNPPMLPQSATTVAAGVQRPAWKQASGPRLEGGAGVGDIGVIMGAPRTPNPGGAPMPRPQPVPRDQSAGIPKADPVKPEELVVQTALVEGDHHSPVSGYIYFPFSGKIKSIKTLELLYGDAVLKLR